MCSLLSGKRPKTDLDVPAKPDVPAEPVKSQESEPQQPPHPVASEGLTEKGKEVQGESLISEVPAVTNSVYIKGFVRPLILRHVEELIKKYGQVKKFWMDGIKTHCYVIVSIKFNQVDC
jgi:hypothetical protein